jgi:hypothetical protein
MPTSRRTRVGPVGRASHSIWSSTILVVNYEEGGERSVLHGDKIAETRLTDLLMPVALQGARDLNMESAYEYGSRVGVWRLIRVFAKRQVIPTIYAVGMALELVMGEALCNWMGWRLPG